MSPPWIAILVAITMNVVWGANPVAVKLGLEAFPPLWTAFLRFCLGLACVALWAKFAGISLRPEPEEWKPYLILSILFGVQIWTMNVGYDGTSGSMGALLIAVFPLVAAMLGHWFLSGDRLDAVRGLGLLIAFIGTGTVLLGETPTGELQLHTVGNWITLLSGCLLGLRQVFSAHIVRTSDPARTMFWQMLLMQPFFLAGALTTETITWEAIDGWAIGGLLFQGVVLAGAGFMIMAYLLKLYRPSTIISFGFITPVSGVALSAWILGDAITPNFVVGLVEVAIGLAIVLRDPRAGRGVRTASPPAPEPPEPQSQSPPSQPPSQARRRAPRPSEP